MQNEIIINAGTGETRVALIERNTFAELHIERDRDRSVAGTVSAGKVTRVLPGMQAAFVDIGLEKAAFLYVGDYFEGDSDEDEAPRNRRRGRNGGNRQVPKIETVLQEGQEIVVQVAKEPIGTKGARITSHVSIAGRHLVLTPWAKRVGVSRRIESDRERRRLREIVNRLRPKDLGFIIRTAGEGTREADLEADIKYLTSVWEKIRERREEVRAPGELHTELALPLRAIRDFANAKTKRIVVDDETVYEEMKAFIESFVADPKPRLERYTGAEPIFDHFGIEASIDQNLGKKVWLKSGGYLIVDQSEALTAIDVNTGRYVGKRDLEETVLKTNLEAVKEVVSQLRFRNIGGLIIIDLIDMETAENREKVYRALQEALRQDKSKTNILKISELGLVEMTRKRTRENLVQMLCEPCSHCEGRGYVLSAESVAYKALREIRKDLPRFGGRKIAVTVSPRVGEMLTGPVRRAQEALAVELGREIEIVERPGMHQEHFEVTALEPGPAVELDLDWLAERREEPEPEAAAETPEEEPAAEAAAEESTPAALAAAAPAAVPANGGDAPAEPLESAPAAVEEEASAAGDGEPSAAVDEEPSAAVDEEPSAAVDGKAAPAAEAEEPPGIPLVAAGPASDPAPDEEEKERVEALAAAAPPGPEVVDAEAENPILPDPQEREEA